MSIRINLEIGHEAHVRTKRTQEGFTHDWEVFVRGCDGADIHNFIEKVVFHLHETFPKPKRVIKEPPYRVKESGYAGFMFPIDIYLRNKDEPKKIKFTYDLNLQPSGPPIIKVQKEKYVFHAPSEDFKHLLLKGGGSIVTSTSIDTTSDNKTSFEEKNQLLNKPKLVGSDILKKHKVKSDETRLGSDSFQDLFGTPIKKSSKVSPDPKPVPKDVNKSTSNSKEKDKGSEKERTKNKSPTKDKDRDRDKSKEKSGDSSERKSKDKEKGKDRSKDRDRNKDKGSKRSKSPRPRSPSPKRIPSPKRLPSPKRPPSPPPPPPPPPVKHKEITEKRSEPSKEKEKKSEDFKKYKKDKRDKEREFIDGKYKDSNKNDYKEHKSKELKPKEIIREKESSPMPPKNEKKEKPKEKEVTKEIVKEPEEKIKEKIEDKKEKHKHKKKDKEKRDKKDKEDKDKIHKIDKKLDRVPQNNVAKFENKEPKQLEKSIFASPKHEVEQKKLVKPLNTLFSEIENDNSNSSISSKEDPYLTAPPPPIETKPEVKPEIQNDIVEKVAEPEKVKVKKEKTKKKEKRADKEEKKRKRKLEAKVEEEPETKLKKEEPYSDAEQNTSQSNNTDLDKENHEEKPEDYMKILRELQHKIMNLQDNSELQKVVQLIAETGRYEVSARTFDFDLCLLERSTVRRLQEFFSIS